MNIQITGIHGDSLLEAERAVIIRALQESDGDVEWAASKLMIGRSTIYRKIQEHGITMDERTK